MGVCTECNQEMTVAVTCTATGRIPWGKETLLPLRMQFAFTRGLENPLENPVPMDDAEADAFFKLCEIGPYVGTRRCPDCNVRPGGVHHPGCDTEECPGCHLQALGCDCGGGTDGTA